MDRKWSQGHKSNFDSVTSDITICGFLSIGGENKATIK